MEHAADTALIHLSAIFAAPATFGCPTAESNTWFFCKSPAPTSSYAMRRSVTASSGALVGSFDSHSHNNDCGAYAEFASSKPESTKMALFLPASRFTCATALRKSPVESFQKRRQC